MRRIADFGLVALLLALAYAVVALEPSHGPVVLSLSAAHGIDVWDLAAAPAVLMAVAVARARFVKARPDGSWSRAGPASAILLGALLLLAGALQREGGPLVPAGGGVLDRTMLQAVGPRPVPVGRWTHLALTYDGAWERLYVNGTPVSRHAAKGRLPAPASPLWIGGNEPWGSHFEGLIDDVRVYRRALSAAELRRDMTRSADAAPGLAAGYPFDAGAGALAADASGHGNDGEIRGAAWAPGRHGYALRFDGTGTAVRIAPAHSLNLTRALTLSAWVRPTVRQDGWRTIIQRQTAAYFLTAGSDRSDRDGTLDDFRAGLIAVAAGWFVVLIAMRRVPAAATRRRWWVPAVLFGLGSIADAALAPDGTLIGPALVAGWLAATAVGRTERAVLVSAASAMAVLSLLSLTGLEDSLAHNDGGTARAAALGALLAVSGIAAMRRASPRVEVAVPRNRFVSR